MKSILALGLATLLLATTSAPAATVTYTSTPLNLNVTASAANTPPLNVIGTFQGTNTNSINFSLPQFDSSLGTLQSVQFTVALPTGLTTATFDVSGVNIVSTATLNRSVSLNITSPAFTNPLGTNTANMTGAPLASALGITLGLGFGSDASLSAPGSTAVQGFSTSSFSTINQLSAVTGAGTLSMSLSATDLYQFTTTAAIGSTVWGGTTAYAGTVGVTYTYAAVPEPTSTALLVAGSLGFLLMYRRQRHAR